MSKLHSKILQWHPKIWRPRYGFVLKWNDLRKACFPARGYCNKWLQCYRPTQFPGTEFGSENCKYGICALSCALPRFGQLFSCRRLAQYGVWNCESTLMQLWRCFAASPLRSACLAMHQTTVQWRQKIGSCSAHAKQGGCRVRQQWGLGVRFGVFGPHWSSCQKIKMMQCALFYCDSWKQKFSTWCFPFFNTGTSPDRTKYNFSGESFHRTVHQ